MILSDRSIKAALESRELVIESEYGYKISPASVDFKLGDVLFKTRPTARHPTAIDWNILGGTKSYYVIDPTDKSTFDDGELINLKELGSYLLCPGEFILGSAAERIELNGNIAMKIFGKSSIGRLALANSEVAGYVDPGFSGVLTLELKNHSDEYALRLTPGMWIGQYVFMRTEPVERSYRETGRYVDQGPGAGSKGI